MKFAIFTNVQHGQKGKNYCAYAPYVREMNLWLRYVEVVEIVAPLGGDEVKGRRGEPGTKGPGDMGSRRTGDEVTWEKGDEGTGGSAGLAYGHKRLIFNDIPLFNFLSFPNAVKAIIEVPSIMMKIFGTMRRADHLHLRCPGNVGLLACICQIFFPSKPKTAKYAGNWDPQAKQPWTYRLQKWILWNAFLTRNMQVLVYGEWPGQSKNIVPFFTASFSEEVIPEVRDKDFSGSINLIYAGNLVEGKRPTEAVKFVQQLRQQIGNTPAVRLDIYGEGPQRTRIKSYCKENQLEDFVQLNGNRSLEELKAAYQKAHFVILPSRSEGWPKVIAEGMFFGCIPIVTPVSCVPWMLGNGSRGVLLENQANGEQREKSGQWSVVSGQNSKFSSSSNESEGQRHRACSLEEENRDQWSDDITKISRLLADPERMKRMTLEAKKWSQQYTLERFEEAIMEILEKTNVKSSSSLGRGGDGG